MAYGVGPRALQILQTYWVWLNMVDRPGRYHDLPFKGYRGVTQGYPLPPTLFNLLVNTII